MTAWDRLVGEHNHRGEVVPVPRQPGRTPLVVRPATPTELDEWRRWEREGWMPSVAVEILGALLAALGEDT